MTVETEVEIAAAHIAAAIGEPARARMLYCLLDGRARTSTELSLVANVSPSTASVHLGRLNKRRLVKVLSQGRHRYYSLDGVGVAQALEALSVVAGERSSAFRPGTPPHLRTARSCYDHMAGVTAVRLRERLQTLCWLRVGGERADSYELTDKGSSALVDLGIDVPALRLTRRRFAYACVDWSERCPHIAGALGDAILRHVLDRKWFVRELDTRALRPTPQGRRQLQVHFGLSV